MKKSGIDELIAALEFYASPQKYESVVVQRVTKVDKKKKAITVSNFTEGPTIEWRYDQGERARRALNKFRKTAK